MEINNHDGEHLQQMKSSLSMDTAAQVAVYHNTALANEQIGNVKYLVSFCPIHFLLSIEVHSVFIFE